MRRRASGSPLLGDPVADIANILDDEKIPHVFTGSLAYSAWVTPMATKDVDVVVYTSGRVGLARLFNRLARAGVDVDPAQALRELDALDYVGVPMPVAGSNQTFVVEIIKPTLRALSDRILRRSMFVPYTGRPNGIRIVSVDDLVLYKLIFFRPKDLLHVDEILVRFPMLDVGQILLELRGVYPESDERIAWFLGAERRRGLGQGPPQERKRAAKRKRRTPRRP